MSRLRRTVPLAAVAAVMAALLAAPGPTVADSPRGPAKVIDAEFRPSLITVDTPTPADKRRLADLGLDLTEHGGRDYVEVVVHSAAELLELTTAGFTYDVRIADLVKRGAEIREIDEAYAARVGRSPLPSGRTGYRQLVDYKRDMDKLEAKYPKHVKHFKLQRNSLDGRHIYGLEIGQNVNKANTGRPTFLLMGVHHAREWPSGELAMEFAFDLAQGYGRNPRITALLQKARVIVIPVVNVDGFNLSRRDGEFVDLRDLNEVDPLGGSTSILGTPGRAYMRKNCRIVDGQVAPQGTCAALLSTPGGYGHGVDLNRNYGGFWGGPGASALIADPTYRGASAFSEPETQNIRDLIRTRNITMMISNHTFSNLVLRPNGVNPQTIGADGLPVGDAPDEQALKQLGARMTAQNGYANIHGWQLYDTTGTTEDYSYNATGGFGYTFEIGANEFHPPFPEVVDEYVGAGRHAGKGNRAAYLIALEHAVDRRYSGVLRGTTKPGTVLRLKKTFRSPTWEGSFADFVDTRMTVPRSGKVNWLVNPSTRPVVRPRTYQLLSKTPFASETFTGGPSAPNSSTDFEYVVRKKAAVFQVDLDWPTPDDFDLEVYKMVSGRLVEVGSSGNAPGEKEQVLINDATPGTYVLRVVNFAAASPTYELKASLFGSVTKTTAGKRESYTLTCSRAGKVLDTQRVFIDRGQVKGLDLRGCRS
ncbi:MAG: cpt [Nocardioides sp.]|nr:cpt [Nocardioides sp.]